MIYYFANIYANTLTAKLHNYQVAFVNTFESEEHDKNYINQVLFRIDQRKIKKSGVFFTVSIRWLFLLSMQLTTDNDPQNVDAADKLLNIINGFNVGFTTFLEIEDQPLGIARNGNYLHQFVLDAEYSVDQECFDQLMNGDYQPDEPVIFNNVTLNFSNTLK